MASDVRGTLVFGRQVLIHDKPQNRVAEQRLESNITLTRNLQERPGRQVDVAGEPSHGVCIIDVPLPLILLVLDQFWLVGPHLLLATRSVFYRFVSFLKRLEDRRRRSLSACYHNLVEKGMCRYDGLGLFLVVSKRVVKAVVSFLGPLEQEAR